MSQFTQLLQKLADPAASDAEVCLASDQLAAAVDAVMRGPTSLQDKIEAVRVAEARGWDALLPEYLSLLALDVPSTHKIQHAAAEIRRR